VLPSGNARHAPDLLRRRQARQEPPRDLTAGGRRTSTTTDVKPDVAVHGFTAVTGRSIVLEHWPPWRFTAFQRINSVAAGSPHPLNWAFLFTP
jgi:hypothetical protein